jgi:cell division protein FtsW (lipid II flippase)
MVRKEDMSMAREVDDRILTICAWIFVSIATIFAAQGALEGLPRHGTDLSWPDHARFHVTFAAFVQIGYCMMTATVALIPFRRRERWSWWALLGFFVFGGLSLIPAALWQGSGPQAHFVIPIALTFAAGFTALFLSHKVGFPNLLDNQNE